jgi:ABC-type transport system involved in multi-copper enzyme maturation permease subunit
MSFRAWRLAFKMQRLELLLFLAAAVLLVVASVLIASRASGARAAVDACYQASGTDTNCATSPSLNDFSLWGGFARLGAFLAPFALGLFLGVPVVAREIEGRTAGIAWTLSRSRSRWLIQRVLPLVVVVTVLTTAIGIGSEFVTRTNPFADLAANPGFADYTSRGVLLPVRALAILSLGIAVGAMVPRQLPALLLAVGVTIALFVGLSFGMDAWMTSEAKPIPIDESRFGLSGEGPRIFDVAYRDDATGEVITMNDFYNRYGDVAVPDGEQGPEGFTEVAIGIPGSQYWIWTLRESAILGALAGASGGLAMLVVARRRP